MQKSVSEAEIMEYLWPRMGELRKAALVKHPIHGDRRSAKAAGRNEASASTGVIGGRMMNNPKHITVAVVAALFLFTGIAFGQWPDDLQQAAVVTAQ